MRDPDVVVVGAGADGPACAARLATEHGLDVLVLEAGPFYGNTNWEQPNAAPGGEVSDSPDDLDGELLDEQFTVREADANDPTWGYLRVGPADRSRAPWFRNLHQNAFIWQISAVGGTTNHYFANHPRAYPYAIDEQDHWPIDYEDLVPYYRVNERVTNVQQAPVTAKEEMFVTGADRAGYDLLTDLNVTETGYRPQPNAIDAPPAYLNAAYDGGFSYDADGFRGETLVADGFQGAPTPPDAPVREKKRKSSAVSWVPRALDANDDPDAGDVAIRPNSFVTDIRRAGGPGPPTATGVAFRDTWSGRTRTVDAEVTVLAAGCIESPRLWLNSGLPNDGWVGRGLTTHWFDWVVGVYPEEAIEEATGDSPLGRTSAIEPYVGQNSAARFDKPGVGGLEDIGLTPGLGGFGNYLFSRAGYGFDAEVDDGEPWDGTGYVVGEELKRKMADYRRTKAILVLTDDLPHRDNGVRLDDGFGDEHGPVARVRWTPHEVDDRKRDELARIAATIHREAGAEYVHRVDWPPLLLHMQSSMAMGKVLDAAAEAKAVDRLFVADHSALSNSLGGPNPTNTGQALALRTADKIAERYFTR